MKNLWMICLCSALILSGCTRVQAAELPQRPVPLPAAEPEEALVEDMENEQFKLVRYRIQEELLVFDASRLDDGLMSAARDEVQKGMDKTMAKTAVETIIETHADLWKQEIISENLEYLVGEYSRSDFERMVRSTSNDQVQGMITAYVLEKLKQEGYQFYE